MFYFTSIKKKKPPAAAALKVSFSLLVPSYKHMEAQKHTLAKYSTFI